MNDIVITSVSIADEDDYKRIRRYWGIKHLVTEAMKQLKLSIGYEVHAEWYTLFEEILSRKRPMSQYMEWTLARVQDYLSRSAVDDFRKLRDALEPFTLEQLTKVKWELHPKNSKRFCEAFRWTERTRVVLAIFCDSQDIKFMLAPPPKQFWDRPKRTRVIGCEEFWDSWSGA